MVFLEQAHLFRPRCRKARRGKARALPSAFVGLLSFFLNSEGANGGAASGRKYC
jgi:hypothetical protein